MVVFVSQSVYKPGIWFFRVNRNLIALFSLGNLCLSGGTPLFLFGPFRKSSGFLAPELPRPSSQPGLSPEWLGGCGSFPFHSEPVPANRFQLICGPQISIDWHFLKDGSHWTISIVVSALTRRARISLQRRATQNAPRWEGIHFCICKNCIASRQFCILVISVHYCQRISN